MSRGRIIYTTNKRHQFTEADPTQTSPADPYQYLQVQKIPTTTPRPRGRNLIIDCFIIGSIILVLTVFVSLNSFDKLLWIL